MAAPVTRVGLLNFSEVIPKVLSHFPRPEMTSGTSRARIVLNLAFKVEGRCSDRARPN